jgi:hypothetical protein
MMAAEPEMAPHSNRNNALFIISLSFSFVSLTGSKVKTKATYELFTTMREDQDFAYPQSYGCRCGAGKR